MDNLLYSCSFVMEAWYFLGDIFRINHCFYSPILDWLESWNLLASTNHIVNRAWVLSTRFIVWHLRKDINAQVFRNHECLVQHVWELISQNIHENILVFAW